MCLLWLYFYPIKLKYLILTHSSMDIPMDQHLENTLKYHIIIGGMQINLPADKNGVNRSTGLRPIAGSLE